MGQEELNGTVIDGLRSMVSEQANRIDQLESAFAELAAELSNAYQNLQDTVLLLNLSETALIDRLAQNKPITLELVQNDRVKLLERERASMKERKRKAEDDAALQRGLTEQ